MKNHLKALNIAVLKVTVSTKEWIILTILISSRILIEFCSIRNSLNSQKRKTSSKKSKKQILFQKVNC